MSDKKHDPYKDTYTLDEMQDILMEQMGMPPRLKKELPAKPSILEQVGSVVALFGIIALVIVFVYYAT